MESKLKVVKVLLQKQDFTKKHLKIVPLLYNCDVLMEFFSGYFSNDSYEILEYVLGEKLL
jgi:hypothetical protein